MTRSRVLRAGRGRDRDRLLTQGHQGRGDYRLAESRRMTKSELFAHFAELRHPACGGRRGGCRLGLAAALLLLAGGCGTDPDTPAGPTPVEPRPSNRPVITGVRFNNQPAEGDTRSGRGGVAGGERRVELADAVPLGRLTARRQGG